MALTDFKIQFQIPKIFERLDTENKIHLKQRLRCGSLSSLSILEYFNVDYDIEKFINDANDGDAGDTGKAQDGSTILDIVYALANSGLVDIEFYIADDTEPPKNEEEKAQLEKDNAMRKKIRDIGIVTMPPITIDEILTKTKDDSIPILGFHKKGNLADAHFSPLRGINGPILMFTLDSQSGDCNVYKDEFVDTWWTLERELLGAIIVKKKKLNEYSLLAKADKHLQNNETVEFKILSGFDGMSWSGVVGDSDDNPYFIDDEHKDALWEAMVEREWTYGLEIKSNGRYISFSKKIK